MLVLAHVVVSEEVYGDRRLERCQELARGIHVLFIGIDTLDEGNTDKERMVVVCQVTDVLKDEVIAHTRLKAMLVWVHDLQVGEYQFAFFGHHSHYLL